MIVHGSSVVWPLFVLFNCFYCSSHLTVKRDVSRILSGISGSFCRYRTELCIFGHLGLVYIWSCFVSCLLFLLFYVILRNLCSGTHRRNRIWRILSISSDGSQRSMKLNWVRFGNTMLLNSHTNFWFDFARLPTSVESTRCPITEYGNGSSSYVRL